MRAYLNNIIFDFTLYYKAFKNKPFRESTEFVLREEIVIVNMLILCLVRFLEYIYVGLFYY